MALLAQTCSKIGNEDAPVQGNAQGVRVVNAGEVISPGWVVVDPSKQGQVAQAMPQNAISFAGGQVSNVNLITPSFNI